MRHFGSLVIRSTLLVSLILSSAESQEHDQVFSANSGDMKHKTAWYLERGHHQNGQHHRAKREEMAGERIHNLLPDAGETAAINEPPTPRDVVQTQEVHGQINISKYTPVERLSTETKANPVFLEIKVHQPDIGNILGEQLLALIAKAIEKRDVPADLLHSGSTAMDAEPSGHMPSHHIDLAQELSHLPRPGWYDHLHGGPIIPNSEVIPNPNIQPTDDRGRDNSDVWIINGIPISLIPCRFQLMAYMTDQRRRPPKANNGMQSRASATGCETAECLALMTEYERWMEANGYGVASARWG